MYKRKIKYTDFNGNEREEDFYFNLTKTEVIKANLSVEGTLQERLIQLANQPTLTQFFPMLEGFIRLAYGEKSLDGKNFNKTPEIANNFINSAAYDALIMEFLDAAEPEKALADFINAIIPEIPEDEKAKAQAQIEAKLN